MNLLDSIFGGGKDSGKDSGKDGNDANKGDSGRSAIDNLRDTALALGSVGMVVHGAMTEPQQSSLETEKHWGESSLHQQAERTNNDIQSGTNDHNNQATSGKP